MSAIVADPTLDAVLQAAGIAVFAGGVSAAVALGYRWYVRERVPMMLAVLAGLAVVAVYLNTTTALGRAVGTTALFSTERVAFNGGTFLASLVTTTLGLRIGDSLGQQVFEATRGVAVDTDVSRVVQAVGRVIAVEIPDDIADIPGYDPVPEETKAAISGRRFLFPRGLTAEELQDRLVTRLKSDYGVGYVDIELADDGNVEYLALGSRIAGIGPTLPPETAAVAVRADPAHAASSGDLVQVWRTDPLERVLTAEVRAVAGDVVTLAVDMADALALDDETTYRLVTLPVETRPDREFASLLRGAEETTHTVEVVADSAVAGQPVGALDVTVLAIKDESGGVDSLPDDGRVVIAGDELFLLGRPDQLRKVDDAATTPSVTASVADVPAPEPSGDDDAVESQSGPAGAPGTEPDETAASEPTDSPGGSEPTDAPAADASEDGPVATDSQATPPERSVEEDTPDTPEEAGAETAGESGTADAADAEPTPSPDPASFDDLKAEFETGDADWDDGDDAAEDVAASVPLEDAEESVGSDPKSFEELQAEVGEDDVSDDAGAGGDEFEPGDDLDGDPGLDGLHDDAESDGSDAGGLDDLADDDLVDLDEEGWDGLDDGLTDLDDGETDLEGSDSDAFDTSDADGDESADDGDADGDESSGGTFQQLKEEFESGEADWEDDVEIGGMALEPDDEE